jgi:glycosyltransferase involved in cell wall biosynthesis
VYAQDPFGTALAGTWLRKRFSLPLIIGNHSNFLDNRLWIAERPLFFSMLNKVAHYTLPRADAWRVLNDTERAIYTTGLHLPEKRIYMLNTPVPLAQFYTSVSADKCAALRQKLEIPVDAPVVLWVGRPVRVKRLPILFKAFRIVVDQIPNARLVLVGKQQLRQEPLERYINDERIAQNVVWLKSGVPHAELPAYYQMANVYLQTSNYEGFGKVMVEAAASGLPVVSTKSAGAERIVCDGETGFLVPIDDARACGERIIWLLNDAEQAQRMGEQGCKHVLERFDYEHNMQAIVTMWREVATRGLQNLKLKKVM